MSIDTLHRARSIARHPGVFLLQTLKAFRANQAMLLAGAVAYYALLLIVTLLILIVIALSPVVDPHLLLDTLACLLRWLVPGQADALVRELAHFLAHRAVIGLVLVATMFFFSSLAFTAGERDVSHLRASDGDPPASFHAVSAAAVLLHPFSQRRPVDRHICLYRLAGGRRARCRAVLSPCFAAGTFVRVVISARLGRRNLRADLDIPCHASWPSHAAACIVRRRDSGATAGNHASCAGLVFRRAVSGQRSLRLADDGHRDRQPELLLTIGEDAVALAGVMASLLAVVLSVLTGNPVSDACGSIAVGLILMGTANFSMREIKSLIVGEAAHHHVRQAMHAWLAQRPEVRRVVNLIMLKWADDLVVPIQAELRPHGNADDLVRTINQIENDLKAAFPSAKWIFFEPELRERGSHPL